MDEDAQWLNGALASVAPKLTFTLWRGLTPLKDWWLLVCGQTDTHLLFPQSAVAARDATKLTRHLRDAKLIP